jgi:hypothetical protein
MATLGWANCIVIAVLVGIVWSFSRFDPNRAVADAAVAYQQDATQRFVSRFFTHFVAQWAFGPAAPLFASIGN